MAANSYPSNYAYQVLGVEKDADHATIKRAYRKLIGKYHPDRTGALSESEKEQAEQKAAEVNKAFRVLENEENRKMYDQGLMDFDGNKKTQITSQSFRSMNDVFEKHFSDDEDTPRSRRKRERAAAQAKKQRHPKRPVSDNEVLHADVHRKISLEFEEAALGATKRVELDNGRAVNVKLPEGLSHGQRVKVKGKGNNLQGKTGDLYVEIHVNDHAFFERHGNDVHVEVEVSLEEALLGTNLTVETLRGTKEVVLNKGGNTNEAICLEGEGIKGGNQYVNLRVILPDEPDSDLVKAVESWAEKRRPNPATPKPSI
jgi:DnaJ-class molecular chaperone